MKVDAAAVSLAHRHLVHQEPAFVERVGFQAQGAQPVSQDRSRIRVHRDQVAPSAVTVPLIVLVFRTQRLVERTGQKCSNTRRKSPQKRAGPFGCGVNGGSYTETTPSPIAGAQFI